MKRTMALLLSFALAATSFLAPSTESAAAKIKLNKKKITIQVGKTAKLKVKGTKRKVRWSSNKKSIATVSKKGLVKGKKAGKAKITAKVGKKKYTCTVTVKKKKKKPVLPTATKMPVNIPVVTQNPISAPVIIPTNSPISKPTATPMPEPKRKVEYITTQYDDAVIKKHTPIYDWDTTYGVTDQLGNITAHFNDGTSEEVRNTITGLNTKLVKNISITGLNTEVIGDYNAELSCQFYDGTVTKKIRVSVKEPLTEGDFEYVSNGKIAAVLNYTGTSKTIVVPNEIQDAQVVEVEQSAYRDLPSGETEYTKEYVESITLPKGLRIFYPYAGHFSTYEYDGNKYEEIYGWYSLGEINIDTENPNYSSRDGVVFDKEQKILLCYPRAKKTVEYTIPNTVETIASGAFNDMGRYLKKVTIPKSVSSIKKSYVSAFNTESEDTALEEITVDKENMYFKSDNGILYSKDMKTLFDYPAAKRDNIFSIPEGVTAAVGSFARENKYIESLTIPSTLEMLGEFEALLGCSNLKNVYINRSELEDFEDGAYYEEIISHFIEGIYTNQALTIYVRNDEMRNYILEHLDFEYKEYISVSTNYNW